ncbi:hypothetical protein QBC38DRAFT_479273 [Podospora fimiseda]|uniref:Uncharacterized protein n=1 Tax=Podospora fimiseda TaxID=252190 RepID=A0AAN7GTU7_9PEZI|nr:hypothetical protein QBC38DRAFT_479273 [Podospora fimiseda]
MVYSLSSIFLIVQNSVVVVMVDVWLVVAGCVACAHRRPIQGTLSLYPSRFCLVRSGDFFLTHRDKIQNEAEDVPALFRSDRHDYREKCVL